MSARLHRAVTTDITAVLMTTFSLKAAANPLCASPEERQSVESVLKESPKSSPAKIGSATGIPEAAVVRAQPMEARIPMTLLEFDSVWQALTELQNALVIVLWSDSVFELMGPLPKGEAARGYFNFDHADSPYGGHLKVDRRAASYLLSTDGDSGETHQVAFCDNDGRRVFSVYVPRDDEGRCKRSRTGAFYGCDKNFGVLAESSLLTDSSCLWEMNQEQDTKRSEDRN
jgi:putative heme utilization carrier protein HutX